MKTLEQILEEHEMDLNDIQYDGIDAIIPNCHFEGKYIPAHDFEPPEYPETIFCPDDFWDYCIDTIKSLDSDCDEDEIRQYLWDEDKIGELVEEKLTSIEEDKYLSSYDYDRY